MLRVECCRNSELIFLDRVSYRWLPLFDFAKFLVKVPKIRQVAGGRFEVAFRVDVAVCSLCIVRSLRVVRSLWIVHFSQSYYRVIAGIFTRSVSLIQIVTDSKYQGLKC